jgi:hypothetical protein
LPEECIGHNSKLVIIRMFSDMNTGTPHPYPASCEAEAGDGSGAEGKINSARLTMLQIPKKLQNAKVYQRENFNIREIDE